MPKNDVSIDTNQADIFSRGSLTFTFDLIRKSNPQLALTIRNISSGNPILTSDIQTDDKNTDYFQVGLDSFQVRSVVELLMKYNKQGGKDSGMMVVAKALLDEWMALAKKMISELPEAQRP